MIVRTLTSTHARVGSRRHTTWCGRIWLDGWAWLVVSSHCTDGLEGSLLGGLLGVLLGARRLKMLGIETFGHFLGTVYLFSQNIFRVSYKEIRLSFLGMSRVIRTGLLQ